MVAAVLVQVGLGALVAGLHAGLTYNTWPLMDGRIVPPLADLARQSPLWSNLFENITTVQFDHRMVAYLVLGLALYHAADAMSVVPGTPVARRAVILARCRAGPGDDRYHDVAAGRAAVGRVAASGFRHGRARDGRAAPSPPGRAGPARDPDGAGRQPTLS